MERKVESIMFVQKARKTLNSAFVDFTQEDKEREETIRLQKEIRERLAEEDRERRKKKRTIQQLRVKRSRYATIDGETYKRRVFVEENLKAGGTITLFTKHMLFEEMMRRQLMINGKKDNSIKKGVKYDNIVCFHCNKGHGDDEIILCDRCNDSFHLYCLVPPLQAVPEGEWLCVICSRKSLWPKDNPPPPKTPITSISTPPTVQISAEAAPSTEKQALSAPEKPMIECKVCGFRVKSLLGLKQHTQWKHPLENVTNAD